MAISDVLKGETAKKGKTPAAAPAPAPAVQGAAPTVKKSKGTSEKTDKFRATGAAERKMMTEDQKAIEGTKQDKVEFICALGNPSVRQGRREGNETIPSHKVIGYKFKVLEDCMVPVAKIKENYTSYLDTEPITERPAKAGEIIAMNPVEMAQFISKIEYAGKFTGGAIGVGLSAKTSDDRQEPLPVLNRIGKGSVKENMELIGEVVGGDGTVKGGGHVVLKPEYEEMYGMMFRKNSLGKKGSGVSRKEGETQADLAAAFRTYYAQHKMG